MVLYKLSIPQKTILDTEEYFPEDTFNNVGGIIILKKTVSAKKINSAINRIIEKHDVLRMKLTMKDGEYYQYFEEYKPKDIQWEWLDYKGKPDEFRAWLNIKEKQKLFCCDKFLYDNKVVILPSGEVGICIYFHHIILDAYSIVNNFCTYLISEIYDINLNSDDENYYYANYIETEEEYLNSIRLKKDEKHWNEQLSLYKGEAFYKGAYSQEIACTNSVFNIGEELTNQINTFCKDHKVSVYNLFMSSIMYYKSILTRNRSVSIGTSTLNRKNSYERKTIGMFTNVLPMIMNIEEDWSVINFIKEVNKKTVGLFRHQRYEYRKIRERYNEIAGDLQDLLEITLTYLNAKVNDKIDHSLYELDMFRNSRYSEPFLMTVMDFEDTGSIEIEYKLQNEKISKEEVKLIHGRLINIIKQFIVKPTENILKVEVLDLEEQNHMLENFNNTKALYPRDLCIHQIFEEQVKKTPNNIAVKFAEIEITYKELNSKANQLARHLIENNIGRDDFVGIVCDRSVEMIIAIYAVLKAGGAYVPMNPDYPIDRIEYMLEDCEAKVVLIGHKGLNLKNDIKKIDLFDSNNYRGESDNLECINKPEDLIYLIYTSGTTGKPKGVMLEHRNVVRLFKNDCFQFEFNDKDVWTMFHSYCFDFSVWEMYGATLFGGKLIVLSKYEAQDSFKLLEILESEKVTVLNQVPSSFYNLMSIDKGDKKLHIRYLIFGGEALNPSRLREWYDSYPEVNIINMYGITETTVHVTYRKISKEEIEKGISDIGKAIPTLKIYILSDNKLCGIGMPGELCVAGAGLARGYFKRPDLTEKKFAENPFVKGERLYHSGDLAKFLPDGNIEYLGRIDEQVKVRGFRIELGEIDNVIRKQEGIKDVAIIIKSDEIMDKQICAYIVGDGEINKEKLKEKVREELPDYMIPMFITQIDKIPINANGKLDKKALLQIKLVNEDNYVAPITEIEKVIETIYEEILGINHIGIKDNFYEIGGDSIKAIKIVSKIREVGYELNVKEFMFAGNIQKLAELLEEKNQLSNSTSMLLPKFKEIQQDDKIRNQYPVSAAQQRIYLASQIEGATEGYSMLGALKIQGPLNEKLLEESFQKIVDQNEILRTSFDIFDNEIVQVIHPKLDFKLEKISIEAEDVESFYKQVSQQVKSFLKPFSLENIPLLRAYYANYDKNNYILIIDMHHIISDGITLGILLKEVARIYNHMQKGEQIIAKERLQYKDFAVWDNQYKNSEAVMKQKQYWLRRFEKLPAALHMPTDYDRSNKICYEGNKVVTLIDSLLVKKIEKFINSEEITQYMFLLAVYQILLSRYTQQTDIVVGSPVEGRMQPELEEIMGVFVNMIPIRNTVDSDMSFKEFLEQVKIHALEAYENQDYPFDNLVQNLDIKRDSGRNPLFNIALSMENFDINDFTMDKVSITPFELDYELCRFELTLFVITSQPEWRLTMRYQTALYSEESVQRILDNYINIITQVVNEPDILINNINVTTNLVCAQNELVEEDFDFNF